MRDRFAVVLALLAVVVLVSSTVVVTSLGSVPAVRSTLGDVAGGSSPTLPAAFFTTGLNASSVLGKANFTTSPALGNPSTFCNSNTAAFDSAGDLWVADYCNNRVLEFVPPFSNAMAASLVLGQPNRTSNAPGTSAQALNQPSAIAFDRTGDLWVVDSFNNRVLEFVPPFATGMAARLVLGQPSFDSNSGGSGSRQLDGPDDVAFDLGGDLWVAEFQNNRLTEFAPPFTSGMPAQTVLGQTGFGLSAPGAGANHLRGPFGIAFNTTGALWVGDTNNNRILAYPPPFSTGENATFVLGQPDFSSTAPGLGPSSFYGPNYLTFDSDGHLWVGDTNNNRVLEFAPPLTPGSAAIVVLGQPNATARMAHTSATGMSNPAQAIVGPDGDVYVVEFSNSRVVRFAPPLVNGTAADLVLGQMGFTTSTTAPTALNTGRSAVSTYDAAGDLWVVDTYNNRVLEFPAPVTIGETATTVLGQPNLNDSLNGQSASNLFLPAGIAFAPDGALWVSDTFNNRILEFLAPFTTGMTASVVIGQPNFTSAAAATTNRSLALPHGIAFDDQGDLWVADSLNSRVLEFRPPFSNFEAASIVIGQSNFNDFLFGTSPTSLFFPGDVAFDANGTLFVADTDNSRVLSFPAPLTTGEAAIGVVGQTNFYSAGAGNGPGALNDPMGVAIDPRGELWVADTGNNRIVRYSLPIVDGSPANVALGEPTLTGAAPGTTSGSLRGPAGVAVDPVSGGLWVADYGNSRLVYFSGNALAVATGTVVFEAGTGAINQRPTTGVQLNFTGVTGIPSALVVTQRLAGAPVGIPPTGFSNTSYFDITVSPLEGAAGTVQTCLTVPGIQVLSPISYWTGVAWVNAGSVTPNKDTACSDLPLSALTGTPIALAIPSHGPLPSFPSLYLFGYAAIGFVVIVAGLVLFNLRRQRRRAAQAPRATTAASSLPSASGAEGPAKRPPA